MSEYNYRIHPAIGIARVGNSKEYYLGPETAAGLPVPGDSPGAKQTGGLPIKAGTESETITSGDVRDRDGCFKRQAARFRIFQYPQTEIESYPRGEGTEITIGSKINGKKVADIVWTVHVANKKANAYVLVEEPPLAGLEAYKKGQLPPLRNLAEGTDPNETSRLGKLVIDPGPRAISACDAGQVRFDKKTVASYWDEDHAEIVQLEDYPKSFPDDGFHDLYCPSGSIDTLGELETDEQGRLLVLGGYGRACGWHWAKHKPYPLEHDVNNDGWFDDVSDGPVQASLIFDDGSVQTVEGGAWVVTTDPSYAPQTLNVVSLWDDIHNAWVQQLQLRPDIFDNGYNPAYVPNFAEDLNPIFQSAALQQWNTNLPTRFYTGDGGNDPHHAVGNITAADDPANTSLGPVPLRVARGPVDESGAGTPLMPLSLGDANKSFLSFNGTQYFFLQQWVQHWQDFHQDPQFNGPGPQLGAGEYLDKVVLQNCLGGRFSPGIDLTFIVRQSDLYIKNWRNSGTGPFRIAGAALDYGSVSAQAPFLSDGYTPLHSGENSVEPGDLSKFMAIPWHTDYNSCATHVPSPNPPGNITLYWSWPAQRPVTVFPAADVAANKGKLVNPGGETVQRFSVRGEGTGTTDPSNVGMFQNRIDMVENWHKIGVVMQSTAIEGYGDLKADYYLEVESRLDDSGNKVEPWPTYTTGTLKPVK